MAGLLDNTGMLNHAHPLLAARVRTLACRMPIRIMSVLRMPAEQDALFALGRDATGKIVDKKKVVTYARGGQSWHNFGLAGDPMPIENPAWKVPDDVPDDVWMRFGEAAESVGLEWGGRWTQKFPPKGDRPHVQLVPRGYVLGHARADFEKGGLPFVWAHVTELLDRQARATGAT